ncbi:MAG TPA: carboxypeptidase-like regulatory domain-containing protein [Verrucomicrobiae bacterium]
MNCLASGVGGRVLTDSGDPVGHLSVFATEALRGTSAETVTDDAGRFEMTLPDGFWRLRADQAKLALLDLFAPQLAVGLSNGEPRTNVSWIVRRSNVRLGGRVVDDGGAPVPFLPIIASESPQSFHQQGRTDENGRFEFGVVDGSWRFSTDTQTLSELDLFPANMAVVVTNGETRTNLIWVMHRSNARLAGRVVDEQGSPAPNLWVSAYGETSDQNEWFQRHLTDAEGRFDLPVSGGIWRLGSYDYGPQTLRLDPTSFTVLLTNSELRTNLVWVVKRDNATVAGRMVDDTGAPVSYLTVYAQEHVSGFHEETVTDADGRFTMSLFGGSWWFDTDVRELQFLGLFSSDLAVAITNGELRTNLVWVMQRSDSRLTGRVQDDTGNPLGYLGIYAYNSQQSVTTEARTDADGSFEFLLTQGTWRIAPGHPGVAEFSLFAAPLEVSLAHGEAKTNVVWTFLRSNAQLGGRVVDDTGAPLQRIQVSAYDETHGPSAATTTDGEGRFDLAVVGGSWSLSASRENLDSLNLFPTNLTLTVTNGEQRTNVLWVIQRSNTLLAGRVVDKRGVPISYLTISASDRSQGFYRYATTDAEGAFGLPLVGGTWALSADTLSLGLWEVFPGDHTVALTNGEMRTDFVWVVQRPDHEITGRVLSTLGAPLPGLRVFASSSTAGRWSESRTDDRGAYRFRAVAGEWYLSADCQDLSLRGYLCPAGETVTIADTDVAWDFIVTPESTAPRLDVVDASPAEGARLEVSGPPSVTCEIQGSPNLNDWSSILSLTLPIDGRVIMVDPGARGSPHRFYRALRP